MDFGSENLNKYWGILPKHIQINSSEYPEKLLPLIEPYDPSKFSFHQFITTHKTEDILFLQKISKVAKKVTIGKINYYDIELDREIP